MKDKKSKDLILAFTVVALLILSSIGSFGISTDTVDEDDSIQKTNSNLKGATIRIKTTVTSRATLTAFSKSSTFHTLDDTIFNLSENILVAGEDGNESYPSMIVSGYNALVAYEYEDDGAPYIYLRKSNDYGRSWSGPDKLVVKLDNSEISVNSPALCLRPNSKYAYGVYFSPIYNSGIHGIFEIPDIAGDLSNIGDGYWNWSGHGFWNFAHPDIVFHDKPGVPWITGFTGSTTNPAGPCNDSLMFHFQDEDNPLVGWINWIPELENCSNVSLDMDDTSEILYGTCEIQNESNQNLLFFSGFHEYDEQGNPGINLTYQKFARPENLTHPQIFVKDDQIYIVAETDANGENEIIIFNSKDEGDNWYDYIVTENQPPIAAFSYSIERLNVSFFDESTDIDGYIISWFWEFGDGTNSADVNPQHEYDSEGVYIVNLTVKDNENAESKISKTVILSNTTPIADFTYTPINPSPNENITFNSTSTAHPSYFIENYTWDFGDESNLEYEQNVTHQYADNGTYIVNLTIRDNESKKDSIEKIVKVGLVADFIYSPDVPSIGDTVYFNDSSSIPEGSMITDWTWDFGDGTSLVYQQNTTHQYKSPGVYIVNLTIKDVHNSKDSILKQITVKPEFSSFIPRYPMVFANETYVFCSFTLASNIFITNSSDHGKNWNSLKQLNDQIYSVVGEYRYADMPDAKHIIWTDNREGNYDLYSVTKGVAVLNLMIVPGSLNITATDMPFFSTNNWVIFKVNNTGEYDAEDVKIEVIVNRTGNEPYITKYPGYVKYLASGAEKSFKEPIFRITIKGYIKAVYDLEEIDFITVKIMPSETFPDSDPSDNSESIPVSFEDIFPKLSQKPILLTIIKILGRII